MSGNSSPHILVLNGPNLNLLGKREPQWYGSATLAQIMDRLKNQAKQGGARVQHMQSNAEHVLVDTVQSASEQGVDFMIVNPAAFTHTSVALRDAIAAVDIPFIELHLSNVHQREAFRQHSYFSDLAVGVICGLGPQGYELALTAALAHLKT